MQSSHFHLLTLSCNASCGGVSHVNADLRRALAPHGWTVNWVAAGLSSCRAFADPHNPDELLRGHWICPHAADDRTVGRALYDFILSGRFTVVVVNVLAGLAEANLMRYLPRHIPRVMIVHSISPGTYRFARAIRDHVHATVAVSPRIRHDLTTKLSFPSNHTFTVPNAIDLSLYANLPKRPKSGVLRIISLGRLDDTAKGILQIPDMLRRMQPSAWRLTVVGDGPHRRRFQSKCAAFGDRVTFLGSVHRRRVPALFAQHDCFVMPSYFEGFGLTVLEAMAAACVPVTSLIPGVTDFIIGDGESGLLFPPGDANAAAACLTRLAASPETISRLSTGAQLRSRTREFTLEGFGESYLRVFGTILENPRTIAEPLDVRSWRLPRGLTSPVLSNTPLWATLGRLYYRFEGYRRARKARNLSIARPQ